MSDVYTISVKASGPLIVAGPVRVVDPQGVAWEVEEGSSVGLCRCGQSKRKPFCDKTHFEIGFDHPEGPPEDNLPPGVRRAP
jgi:CDGSH-type Zn-finger protein